MTLPEPGLYRHYKGGFYTLLACARHSETEEWHAVYRSEAEGTLWIRPLAMWEEFVGGVPRFKKARGSAPRPRWGQAPPEPHS
jgi:hypothetical protein